MRLEDYKNNMTIYRMFSTMWNSRVRLRGRHKQRCYAEGRIPIVDSWVKGSQKSKCHKVDKINTAVGEDLAMIRCMIDTLVSANIKLEAEIERMQADWKERNRCPHCGEIDAKRLHTTG